MRCSHCGKNNPPGFQFCGHCGKPLKTTVARERRWVTVLFYDVTGYSTYALNHDLEDIHRELDGLLRHCKSCVEKAGGLVDKFVGDGILAVFGVPNSKKDEPSRALEAAVCMVKNYAGNTFQGRAGIATGLVMVGSVGGDSPNDQTVIGDVVNRAQRLVSLAPAGAIWLDETTRGLVSKARLHKLPSQPLKGYSKPVPVWEFRDWNGEPEPLFGRAKELAQILKLLDEASNGKGGVISIVGELGIGKSFLVDTALRKREKSIKPIVLPELNMGDSIRSLLRSTFTDYLAGDPIDFFNNLGLSELDKRLISYALGLQQERPAPMRQLENALLSTMRRALALLAKENPLAIIIHSGSRNHTLLKAMIDQLREKPVPGVAVIITSRRSSIKADISLNPLRASDADNYIKYINSNLTKSQREQIFEEARGNPLGMRLLATSDNPSTILAAFQSRLDKLTPIQRRTLLYAALGLPTTWPGVIRELLGEEGWRALPHLIRNGYLTGEVGDLSNDSRLKVSNSLLQQVAAKLLSPSELKAAHKTYWMWLMGQGEARLAAIAAEHALQANLSDEAAAAWLRAGDYEQKTGIFSEAEKAYRKAVQASTGNLHQIALKKLAHLHLAAGSAKTVLKILNNETNNWANRMKGLALAALKRDGAKPLLLKALKHNPDDVQVELALMSFQPPHTRIENLLKVKNKLSKKFNIKPTLKPLIDHQLAEALAENFRLKEATEAMRNAYIGYVAISNRSRAAEAALSIAGYMWHNEDLSAAIAWADRAIEHGRKAHPGVATAAWSIRAGLWLDKGFPEEAEKALRKAETHKDYARNEHEYARIYAIRIRHLMEIGSLDKAIALGEEAIAKVNHPWLAANLALAYTLKGGRANENKLQFLANTYSEKAPPPAKSVFFLAQAIKAWRHGHDPIRYLKLSLRQQARSGPYLRYLTLILWSIYLINSNPKRAIAIANYLEKKSSSAGFSTINQTARLIQAELALAGGKPISHLLRFEPLLKAQKLWHQSLLTRANQANPQPQDHPKLSNYGILGTWARLSWRDAAQIKRNGSS